jgi:non-specific protein-tyrosine kinase
VFDELAALERPRKHYQRYYQTRDANPDMWHAPQGIHAFLRGYYHFKSADWKQNKPHPLAGFTAAELARMPTYYVMDLARTMAETVAEVMPSCDGVAANRWLPDHELAVYAAEYERNGFQGGLQWYRCGTSGLFDAELQTWSDRRIDVPSAFISGQQDWGIYHRPGVFEAMQSRVCTNMILCELIDRAGHWVQQEQHERLHQLLLRFLNRLTA